MPVVDVIALAPYLERGGTERHILTLAQALPEEYRLQVLAPSGPAQQELTAVGVVVRNFPSLAVDPVRGAREFRRLLRQVTAETAARPQVVHVHGAAELLWLARPLTRTPIVFTVHGYHGGGARLSYKLAAKLGNRLADAVIAVSGSERELLLAAGMSPEKLHLVYNGVFAAGAPKEYNDRSDDASHCGTDQPIIIGTAARLVPAKGLNYLIDALHLLVPRLAPRTVRLLIYGEGPERGALQQQAAALDLGGMVEFCGYQPQVAGLMAHWDIFVLPSVIEPFGLVCAEAMAAGIPVIATRTGGLPEVVGDAGILVPVADAESLAEAMYRLASDPEVRRELGTAGYERYRALFTAEGMALRTAALYDAVLDGGAHV